MVVEKWIGFFVLLAIFDTAGIIMDFYFPWVKKKSIVKRKFPNEFPYNANKRQSIIWFTVWTVVAYLNLGVYTLFCWLFAGVGDPNDAVMYLAAFAVATLGYILVVLIIYAITKNIVKDILEKREKSI